MDQLLTAFEGASLGFWLWFVPTFLLFWFVPTLLAIFFNRGHLKLIFLANIPAGMSFIAWGGCIVWALTGKVWQGKKRPIGAVE